MHELNRPLAQAIYDLEDANAAVANSFAALRASIDLEKTRVQDSFASLLDGLKERLDVVNETMQQSRNIYDMLANAVSGRSVTSGISQTFARREGALGFIRGGDFSDEKKLREALDVVAEPTEDLFGSFVDYARDFARTSITLEEAKKVAQVQLTADEKQVLLLEEQIVSAEANRDAQLDALDQQYQMMVDQYNALLGIDTSVKSVSDAIATLGSAISGLAAAQAAAKAAAAAGAGSNAAQGVQGASAAGEKLLDQLGQSGIAERASDGAKFQKVDIRGTQQLLDVARDLGVKTSGRTGAEIQKAIANAGNIGVNMDNSTRAKQFAMGGYHTGGIRMVGERGPELEATGPSRIFSHNQTASMFRDPDLKDAVRSLKEEVSGLRTEQRQIQMDISKYTRRSYDIERKWDVDGLPATRT
jgi:guanyl-specific ribonuclease Sa